MVCLWAASLGHWQSGLLTSSAFMPVQGHLARMGPSQCARVSTKIFANKAMASRGHLEREVQTLLEEHAARHAGVYPPGNAVESPAWSEPEGEVASVMSPAERERYETKKLKLRKAMGEDVVLPGQEREPDAAERR